MKVIVTGAGGYIGSVLTRLLLKRGHTVRVIDRFFFGRGTLPKEDERLEIIDDDIRFADKNIFKGIDAVLDLAALSNDPSGELDPVKTWSINYLGRFRVAVLAKLSGVKRYIFPSSCSVYGFQDGILTEESEVNPLTTYAKANLKSERDALELADDKFCVVVLRQATVYGLSPRMRFDLAVNGMVRGFFKNGKIPILKDGTQRRPLIHIKDTSRAIILALEADPDMVNGQVFNVGSNEQNYQIFHLAQMVAEAMGVSFAYKWYGLPDHRSYRVNFDKIRNVFGFRPEYTPAKGAREVYEALKGGNLNPDEPRAITVSWYKHLLEQGVQI